MAVAGEAAAAFEGVSKRFRNGVLALSNVSFSVPVGARTCLLGRNGAGKTTAVRLLLGLLGASAGRVRLLGAVTGSDSFWRVRDRVGVLPQSTGAYPDLSVREYLELAIALYGRGRLDSAVELLGLGRYLGMRMSELSGGLLKRTSLAAALLADPQVLVLDEPSLGLDPIARDEIHGYLKELSAGRTMLVCTNDLAEAEALCDRAVILDGGQVVVEDSLAALTHRRPKVFIRTRQPPAELRERLGVLARQAEVSSEGLLVTLDEGDAYDEAAPRLVAAAVKARLAVLECRPMAYGLEDAFFDALRGRPG